MKALIYSGIGLFTVATAFGLVDYYGAQKSGRLEQLYKEDETEQVSTPAKEIKKTEAIPLKTEAKSEPVLKSKTTVKNKIKRKDQVKKDFSTHEITPMYIDPITIEPVTQPLEKDVTIPDVVASADSSKPIVEEKKFEFKAEMFSRAPLKKKKRK